MSALQGWTAEGDIRLGKLTLVILKNGEPRGALTFEDDEEEEAATWLEMARKVNEVKPNVVKEIER